MGGSSGVNQADAAGTEVRRAIEAMLMVALEPVPSNLLAQLLEVPTDEVERVCGDLAEAYEEDGRGFALVRVAGGFRFQSHPDQALWVERFVLEGQSSRLTSAALETLAIVAYKQPVSRAQVSAIRGVDVDGVMRTLQHRGYIVELSRDPGPATPCCSAPPRSSSNTSASIRCTTCHRWASSCRVLRSSRHLNGPAGDIDLGDDGEPIEEPVGDDEPSVAEVLGADGSVEAWIDRDGNRDGMDAGVEGVRLQKVLARVGFGSRRTCDDLIAAGRVLVNGSVAQLGRRVDPETAVILVDGAPVGIRPGLVHYLLNKPAGVVTTADDPQGRPVVVDLVPGEPRVFPVGRLDADTEGLLLLTNDGELAHRLTHPSYGVEKEYVAEVDGEPGRAALRSLREGVELDDGMTAEARASLMDPSVVKLTIHEGRNRQVRRMCEAVAIRWCAWFAHVWGQSPTGPWRRVRSVSWLSRNCALWSRLWPTNRASSRWGYR